MQSIRPTTKRNYVLLTKKQRQPRAHRKLSLAKFLHSDNLNKFVGKPFAFDIEASTLKCRDPELYVRCVALANDDDVVAVDLLDCSDEDWREFRLWLLSQKTIVYNMLYEVPMMRGPLGGFLQVHADCYILVKMLGAKIDSFVQGGHGLGAMEEHVLGWEEQNKTEMQDYLKEHGYSWSDVKKFDWDLLAKYNARDADATWQLYQYFKDMFQENSGEASGHWGQLAAEWHMQDCVTEGMITAEAVYEGIKVDRVSLLEYKDFCVNSMDDNLESFFNDPKLKPHIAEMNKEHRHTLASNPPPKFLRDGVTVSNRYKKWLEKYEASKTKNFFNINSAKQLEELFFDRAGMKPPKLTPKGSRSVDKEAQQSLGKPGQYLLNYNKFKGEIKFLDQLLANEDLGRLHPSIQYPATMTGRVAGKTEV